MTASFAGDENYDPVSLQITIEVNPYNYIYDYMGITPLENGTISFSRSGLEYSTDDGTTWTSLEANTNINVTIGNNILFKGTPTPGNSVSTFGIGTFYSSNNINVYGNINSLLYGDNYQSYNTTQLKYAAFTKLFYNCTHLIDASNLILPYGYLNYVCYESMFEGCSSLIKAPKLLTTSILSSDAGYHVYYAMFKNCTSLEEAPEIRLETINGNANQPLGNMFYGCSSLNFIKLLVTSGHTTTNLSNWTYGVATTGTFIKADNEVWETGASGVPTGWTLLNYGQIPLLWPVNSYTCTISDSSYNWPTVTNPENLTLTYSSSDQTVATINSSTGVISIVGTGTTTISAIFAGNEDYQATTISYTLTITKQNPNLAWSTNGTSTLLSGTFVAPTLSNPNNLTITYTSSDTSVATINSSTGEVTILDEGTTTISAIFAGNSTYESQTVSYSLEVIASGTILDWGTDGSKEVSANPNASYATPLSCSNPAPSVPLDSGYGGITSFQPVMLDSSSPYCIENGASAIIARNNYSSISFEGESSNALTILNTLANDSDVEYAYAWISGYTFGRYDGSTKFCAPKNTTIQAAMVINANAMHTSRVISTTSSSKIWIYGNSTITTSTDGRSAIAPFSGQVDALHAAGKDLMLVIAYKFN